MACTPLADLPNVISRLDVSSLGSAELEAMLAEVRLAQRCLDGLVTSIGQRADTLAAAGRSAPAEELMRGAGAVSSRQARRESARAAAAELVPQLSGALCRGEITGEHADAVARQVARLDDDQRAGFDLDALVARARALPVETFDRFAKREVDVAIGDHGLAAAEAKRAASEFRHWFDRDSGMGRFSGSLDPERYETLTTAIDQHVASIAAASDSTVTRSSNLAATALVELVLAAGGRSARNRLPSITVLLDQETLAAGPHDRSLAQTECGHDLAPQAVARLCCDAVLRRVTLDGRGLPIEVGRAHRTATDAQWAAIKAIHSGCGWADCPAPISWCQAHHIREWERGGKTDLDNLIPLCSRHHHQVHEGGWRLRLQPDRSLEIHRPDGTHHRTVPPPQRC